MTHDYQVQKNRNRKSEFRSKGRSQCRHVTRAFIVPVRRLSLLFSTRWGKKPETELPKTYIQLLSVLIKRNDYLKLLCAVPLAFFRYWGPKQAKITQLNG